MSLRVHELKGCSPVPLAGYLKALGVLRMISEQGADSRARGWWKDERFHLLTELSEREMEEFFLRRYAPTPVLSPWNKGCGFFKDNDPGLVPLEESIAERFEPFRRGIKEARRLLDAQTEADSVIRAIKARTKTNNSFQTDEQRALLKASETYRSRMDELSRAATSGDPPDEIADEMAVTRSMVANSARPSSGEADRLKKSGGYKKLLAAAERRYKGLKETLIPECRRNWRGGLASWMSAAVALDGSGDPKWPSLLGTGGNDGNLDFTNNFMQRLGDLFDVRSERAQPRPGAGELLMNSLWGTPTKEMRTTSVGQFQPGGAGGANSSTGTIGESQVNPWDFVLMMEGTLLFRTNVTRRLDPDSFLRAAAPFLMRSHAAGYGSPGREKSQRGEQWLPIWNRPATLAEVTDLFAEGRVQMGRQIVNQPVAAARAISRLGVSRRSVFVCAVRIPGTKRTVHAGRTSRPHRCSRSVEGAPHRRPGAVDGPDTVRGRA